MRRARSGWLVVAALAATGCTYDFGAAFAEQGSGGAPAAASSSTGGAGGGEASGTSGVTGPGGGGAGGAGGPGGGGSAGGGPAEICSNAVDDDGDDFVDCGDPDCSSHGCTASAPPGWTGPVALYAGDPASPAPPCDPVWAMQELLHVGPLDAPPALCDPCTCSDPQGGTCGIPATVVYDGSNCAGGIEDTAMPPAPDVCVQLNVGDPTNSARGAQVPIDVPGTCAPGVGGATLPAASWAQEAALCAGAPTGAGCPGVGEVCAPRPAAPFGVSLCVRQDGDVACPPGAYTQKTLLFAGADDGRSCSACGCEAATGETCAGHTQIFQGVSCSNLVEDVPNDGTTCGPFSVQQGNLSAKYLALGGPTGGSCAITGGQPTGAATPAGPVTLCCAP